MTKRGGSLCVSSCRSFLTVRSVEKNGLNFHNCVPKDELHLQAASTRFHLEGLKRPYLKTWLYHTLHKWIRATTSNEVLFYANDTLLSAFVGFL